MKKTTLLRKIAFAFSAVLLSSTMTFAQEGEEEEPGDGQRKTDLELTINAPADNASVGLNDTTKIGFTVKNLGPDNLLAKDTLIFRFQFDSVSLSALVLQEDLEKDSSTSFTFSRPFRYAYKGEYCVTVIHDNSLISYQSGGTLTAFWIDEDSTNNKACRNITIEGSNSVNEINAANFSVFPNPATANLTINAGTLPAGNYTLQLVNVTGQIVSQQQVNLSNNTVNVPVADFARGVYFIKISNEGNSYQQRVVLQ